MAFPLISAGIYGYPQKEALAVAVSEIRAWLSEHEMTVLLVVFDRKAVQIGSDLTEKCSGTLTIIMWKLTVFTGRKPRTAVCGGSGTLYGCGGRGSRENGAVLLRTGKRNRPLRNEKRPAPGKTEHAAPGSSRSIPECAEGSVCAEAGDFFPETAASDDEKGMTDVQAYKKANVDRKLFSKIRSNSDYAPSKRTALSFAVALELSLEETRGPADAGGICPFRQQPAGCDRGIFHKTQGIRHVSDQ